jgi:16S rRNA (guanine527-N7)-methyltransferase
VKEFLARLQEENRRAALISFASEDELWDHHVLDSLAVFALPGTGDASDLKAVDVGSGGGFPALPLALFRPRWAFTLVESVGKKEAALGRMAKALGLSTIRTSAQRAETLARTQARETFDAAFCRAVGRLSTVLELTLPLLKVGGRAFLHRGSEGPLELMGSRAALDALGGAGIGQKTYDLPGLRKKRCLLIVEKITPTGPVYPRRPGMPAKRPL